METPKHSHLPLILYEEYNHSLKMIFPQVSYDSLETLPHSFFLVLILIQSVAILSDLYSIKIYL